MSGNFNANTRFPLRQPANVIWSCLWDSSVVIGAPATAGAAYFFKSTVTGADSRGNAGEDVAALFGTTGVFEIQYIIDPSETVLSDTFEITTPATTAPGGKGNEFVILQKKRTAAVNDGSRPQCETMTYLSDSTRRILCVRNKFMLPANLSDIFDSYAAGTNLRWMEFFSCKNGNLTDGNGATDSRFTIQAVRKRTAGVDETGMRYLFRFDLGNGGDPALIWQIYSDEGTLVPGVWHEYVVYIEQPESTSDLTSGVAKCMITNLVTGEVVANFSKQGGQFYGPLGRKLSRVTPQLCYTGGWPATGTIEIKWSDLEFGDNIRYPLA